VLNPESLPLSGSRGESARVVFEGFREKQVVTAHLRLPCDNTNAPPGGDAYWIAETRWRKRVRGDLDSWH
jgi:hypothetical protein